MLVRALPTELPKDNVTKKVRHFEVRVEINLDEMSLARHSVTKEFHFFGNLNILVVFQPKILLF